VCVSVSVGFNKLNRSYPFMETINVLICEDEDLIAHDIQSNLEELGYNVCGITDSCAEAIRLINNTKPDIALMDICLKGEVNGIQTAEILKREHSIPVIYLTSLSDSETIEQAKKTEPLGYINKPFNRKELKSAIEIGLYRHRQQQELQKQAENTQVMLEEEKNKITIAEKIIRMQKQLMEVQKMEAMRTLTTGIAHHVNNTLCAVIGSLQYISECMLSKETTSMEEFDLIKSVLNKCDRTSLVVKKLLMFSENTAIQFEEVPITKLISDSLEDIHPMLKNKFRLETFFPSGQLMISVDRRKVKQVITDLILNAYDSLLHEGVITIRADLKRKEDIPNLNLTGEYYVVVNISDNGAGMNEQTLNHVFEPFFTTKNNGEALGLGLSMAYSTMQTHGGNISINSFEGIGTSVSLYFPVSQSRYAGNGHYH
jgi:signal transduction histidine kinase